MPYTLNGIGTRYAGRKNVSVLVGTCPQCGRRAELSDYDTREWFCFVFVPVVPLRRFRIQSDCASCRRHLRVPLGEFARIVETSVRPLEAAAGRSPGDPDAHLRLAEARIGVRMFREAEDAARLGLAASPKHAGLNRVLGDLLAGRGDVAGAEAPRRLVAAAEPRDATARLALGRTLYLLARYDEACRELEEASRLDPASTVPRLLLAESHFAAGRFAEALQRYEEVSSRDAALASDRQILTRKKECKEKLGFPVSPDERKAARRWWPFGRKGAPARVARGETNWKAVGIAVGAIAVIGAAGAVVVAFQNRAHPDLYLVNGLSGSVTVSLDGENIPVGSGPVVKRTISPGRHRITAKGKGGAVVDTAEADVPAQGWVEALFEPRVYVYNVASAALFRLERIGYAEEESRRSNTEEILSFRQFFPQQKVDFLFEPAPQSISVKGHTSVEFRTALNVARDLDYSRLGALRWHEGKKPEAEKCVRKAVSLAPCNPQARRNLQAILAATDRQGPAVDAAREWIDACPSDRIEPHRAYQDAVEAQGRTATLLDEYRHRLDAAPSDASAHYLYGRLLDTAEGRLAEYDLALALAPDLTRARAARGLVLLTLERYRDAAAELEKAVGAADRDDHMFHALADAAIAGGDADRVGRLLEARRAKEPQSAALEAACWNLMLARRQWDPAERAIRDKERVPDREVQWSRRVQLLSLKSQSPELAAFLDPAKTPKDLAEAAVYARFEQRMAAGAYREAVEALDRETAGKAEPGPLYRLHEAAALALAGDRAGGDARARGVASAPDAPAWVVALADVLLGKARPADAMAKMRVADFHVLGHGYLLLGVAAARNGDSAGARELYRRGEAACTDSDYPLLLLRRLGAS